MRSTWLISVIVPAFVSCGQKQIQVTEKIDSVKYYSDQHAEAARSLQEANAIVDLIMHETGQDNCAPKTAPIADRLIQVRAVMKAKQEEAEKMQSMMLSAKKEVRAYEIMAIALKDELDFREQLPAIINTTSQAGAVESGIEAATGSGVVYINFP